jgi:SET domain-containing protein
MPAIYINYTIVPTLLYLNILSSSRLACHSCSPNTEVVAWKVEGLDCLAMYSVRDIKANESITFDHSPQIQVRIHII